MPRRTVLAENLNNFGLLVFQREPSRAENAYVEAATILEDLMRHGTNRRCVSSLSALRNNQGNLARKLGQSEKAYRYFEQGLALIDDALESEPNESVLRYDALNLHGSRANLHASLGRHTEAVADWDKVIELNDDPVNRISCRLMRILELLRTKDYARGVAEALAVSQQQSDSRTLAGADLYNYGCIFALASVAAKADNRLDHAERRRLAQSYANTSLEWLKRASGAGFFSIPSNREHAAQDIDLAALRKRPEFAKLLFGDTP